MLPHELVSELVVPVFRGVLAHKLSERGMSQVRISRLLGISQPMVSRYLSVPLSELIEELRGLGLDVDDVARITDTLVERLANSNYLEYLKLLGSYINSVLKKGLLCRLHRKTATAIPLDCDVCSTLFGEIADPYVEEVKTAYEILSLHPRGHELVPEVGMNIASAPPEAVDFRDVVGFSGRIVRVYNKVVAAGEPTRGGSRHTASVLLNVMKKFSSIKSVIVIKHSNECIQKMIEEGYNVVRVGPHTSERELFTELEKTVKTLDRAPDAIVDVGGMGIEPVIYVFASSAIKAVKKALICVEN
ncbi:MAG: thiamine-phosphate synthase family protein [Sulfolobales archaeon]